MLYGKHPILGNEHFPEEQRVDRETAGWVIWPRTKAQKNAVSASIAPAPLETQPLNSETKGAVIGTRPLRPETIQPQDETIGLQARRGVMR